MSSLLWPTPEGLEDISVFQSDSLDGGTKLRLRYAHGIEMRSQSFPHDVRHRLPLDRRATAEFLIKFTIKTEWHLLDFRPIAFTLRHTAGPFGVERRESIALTRFLSSAL